MRERQKEPISISAFSTDGSYANAYHATEAGITTTTEVLNAHRATEQEKSDINLKQH